MMATGYHLEALVNAVTAKKLTELEKFERQREKHRRLMKQDQKIIRRQSAMILILVWLGVCICLV